MFFRQIAQKNTCSYPAFFRRTSVRIIYRPDRLVIYPHAHARVNYHLVIFPHICIMYIYIHISTYTYMYILNVHICILTCVYVDISLSVYLKRT